MIGADDGGHQVAAKRRTRLLQQPRLRIHRKYGAVSRKARLQTHGNAGCQFAAKGGRTVQNGLGLALCRQIADQPGVNLRIVLAQTLVATDQDLVCTGANQMLQVTERTLGAHTDQRHQTAAASMGKLAALAHELIGHRGHGIVLVGLNEYPDISIRIEVHRASGLVTLDRDSVDRAGVDAPAA